MNIIKNFKHTMNLLITEEILRLVLSFGMVITILLLYFFQYSFPFGDLAVPRDKTFAFTLISLFSSIPIVFRLKSKIYQNRELKLKTLANIEVSEFLNFVLQIYKKRVGISKKNVNEMIDRNDTEFTFDTLHKSIKKYLKTTIILTTFFSILFIGFLLHDVIFKVYAGLLFVSLIGFEIWHYRTTLPWLTLGHHLANWEKQFDEQKNQAMPDKFELLDEDFQKYKSDNQTSEENEKYE